MLIKVFAINIKLESTAFIGSLIMCSIFFIIFSKGKITRSLMIFEKIEELMIRITQMEIVMDRDNEA